MQYSKFNIELTNPLDSSEVILFNTLEGSMISLPLENLNTLEGKLSQQCTNLGDNDISMLYQLGFLQIDNRNSKEKLGEWFKKIQCDSKTMSLTITTTLACNFDCPYCIQGTNHPAVNMDLATCEDLLRFIEREYVYKPFKELFITYYGGEPLLNVNAIKFFQSKLSKFCNKNKILFRSHLITNGTLVTNFKDQLTKLKISSIKVTLDGIPEYHNKTRYYKNRKPSFNDIIDAIQQIPKGVDVYVGSNFCDDNYIGIKALPEFLYNSKIYHKIKQFNSKPVLQLKAIELSRSDRLTCTLFSDKNLRCWEAIHNNCDVFNLPTINYTNKSLCSYYRKRDITISPDGKIYPCPSFMNSDDYCIGSIYDTHSLLEQCPDIPFDPYCSNCAYFPLCGGGCRYASQLCFGNVKHLNCEKEFINVSLSRSILKELLSSK